MIWRVVNQSVEYGAGENVTIYMTIQYIDEVANKILAQRTLSGHGAASNPNLGTVILNQLYARADQLKAEILNKISKELEIGDLTASVETHLNE